MSMRRILLIVFLIFPIAYYAQFDSRILVGKTFGEFSCGQTSNPINDFALLDPFPVDHYGFFTGKYERNCILINDARLGFGFKYTSKNFFVELNPAVDFNSYNYTAQVKGYYQYFADFAQTIPFTSQQIEANGWNLEEDWNSTLGTYKVFAGVLNISIGYQISEKQFVKFFVSETKMSKNQFGQVLYGDPSGRREVYYEGKGSFEIFTPTTWGLNYEYMFAKRFFIGVSSSILLRAKDQNGESFYLPTKRSIAVSLNLGFQLPNKQERKIKVKKTRKSSTPKIL